SPSASETASRTAVDHESMVVGDREADLRPARRRRRRAVIAATAPPPTATPAPNSEPATRSGDIARRSVSGRPGSGSMGAGVAVGAGNAVAVHAAEYSRNRDTRSIHTRTPMMLPNTPTVGLRVTRAM